MKNPKKFSIVLVVLLLFTSALAMAGEKAAPTTEQQLAGLVSMCSDNAAAQADRQKVESLYHRLGGYDRIHALTEEIVRLHQVNEDFRLMMKYVDAEHLAKNVADFMAAGTGGTAEYTGRDMVAAHAHLQFTEADFLSAGGDVMKAMQSLGYEQNEIDEVICILVSMKDMVIYK